MVGFLIFEAIERIFSPLEVDAFYMLVVAIIGLIANMISVALLQKQHKGDLNVQGVFSHILADTVSSIGIIIVSIMIYFTGWNILDPIVSFIFAVLIISWAYKILKESSRILLEIAPEGLSTEIIADHLKSNFKEIETIFHIHLWTITSDINVISLNIKLQEPYRDSSDHDELIERITNNLRNEYNIVESTIQISHHSQLNACEL
ncbi:MAG: cation diffusion facilitator family transporter [Candidatus Lokiarchaeota archaeon]|nr:cation diffusion facilitator family transporter [Candidatus Lokiarchaeota archaeon]